MRLSRNTLWVKGSASQDETDRQDGSTRVCYVWPKMVLCASLDHLRILMCLQNMILTNTCCLTMGYWPMKSNAKIGEISREEYLLPPDSDG